MGCGLAEVTGQSWTCNKDSPLQSLGLSLYTPVCLHTSHTKYTYTHTHPTDMQIPGRIQDSTGSQIHSHRPTPAWIDVCRRPHNATQSTPIHTRTCSCSYTGAHTRTSDPSRSEAQICTDTCMEHTHPLQITTDGHKIRKYPQCTSIIQTCHSHITDTCTPIHSHTHTEPCGHRLTLWAEQLHPLAHIQAVPTSRSVWRGQRHPLPHMPWQGLGNLRWVKCCPLWEAKDHTLRKSQGGS